VLAFILVLGTLNRPFLCDRFKLLCDAEALSYQAAVSCAEPKSCAAGSCFTDYRRTYPDGRYKQRIDGLAEAKGGICPPDTVEPAVYERARACAASKTCGANECIAEYRRLYPNGAFKAQIDQISIQKGIDCGVLERDRAAYERADRCARALTCGAIACVADYRRDFPSGRFKDQIDQIAASPNAQMCPTPNPTPNLEREAYDRAEQCARPLNCGANSCLTEYRRDYPNGSFKAQIDRISELKGAACQTQPQLPPFRPYAGEDTGFRGGCAALRNPEPIEKMICADGDFARANGELQRAFNSRIERLGAADQARLRQEERNWISRRDSECNIPRRGDSWDEMALRSIKTCFLDKTRARTNELQQ
jgi:uncharacterized protein YecT (DUF1311 family)